MLLYHGFFTTLFRSNPANVYSSVEFRVLKASENTEIHIFDIQSNLVLSKEIGERYQGQEILDLRRMPPGTYLIELVQNGEQLATSKLVKL